MTRFVADEKFYEEVIQNILDKRAEREKAMEGMPEGPGKEIAKEMEKMMRIGEDRGIAALRGEL